MELESSNREPRMSHSVFRFDSLSCGCLIRPILGRLIWQQVG